MHRLLPSRYFPEELKQRTGRRPVPRRPHGSCSVWWLHPHTLYGLLSFLLFAFLLWLFPDCVPPGVIVRVHTVSPGRVYD